jgi:hypothetical protein
MIWRRGAFGYLGARSFFWSGSAGFKAANLARIARKMHLRQPSFDRGVTSFLWAFGLGLYLWLGMLAVGVSGATAFIFSVLAACGIFLFVRRYGGDEVRPLRSQSRKRAGSR